MPWTDDPRVTMGIAHYYGVTHVPVRSGATTPRALSRGGTSWHRGAGRSVASLRHRLDALPIGEVLLPHQTTDARLASRSPGGEPCRDRPSPTPPIQRQPPGWTRRAVLRAGAGAAGPAAAGLQQAGGDARRQAERPADRRRRLRPRVHRRLRRHDLRDAAPRPARGRRHALHQRLRDAGVRAVARRDPHRALPVPHRLDRQRGPAEPALARTERADIRAHPAGDAGYATAIAGKWQLGSLAERPRMPQESGFDESCCWSLERVAGRLRPTPDNGRYFAPRLWQNGSQARPRERPARLRSGDRVRVLHGLHRRATGSGRSSPTTR